MQTFAYSILIGLISIVVNTSAAFAGSKRWALVGQHYHTKKDSEAVQNPFKFSPKEMFDQHGLRYLKNYGKLLNLDAMVITEHNTYSHCRDSNFKSKSNPSNPSNGPILICGNEWTSKKALHASLVFSDVPQEPERNFVPKFAGSKAQKSKVDQDLKKAFELSKMVAAREKLNHLLIINHPGWSWYQPLSLHGAHAAEIGVPSYSNPKGAMKWWISMLQQGNRITALGSADHHPGSLFRGLFNESVNAVHVENVDPSSILTAIKNGEVLVLSNSQVKARIKMEIKDRWLIIKAVNAKGLVMTVHSKERDIHMRPDLSFESRIHVSNDLFTHRIKISDGNPAGNTKDRYYRVTLSRFDLNSLSSSTPNLILFSNPIWL